MKTICICGPYPEPTGGVSIHVRRLSEAIQMHHKVNLIDESPIFKEGVFNVRSLNFFRYIKIISKSDLIHVNSSLVILRFLHVVLSVLLFKKIIITVHSYRRVNLLYRLFNYFCFRVSDVNIVVSEEISKIFYFDHLVVPAFIKPSKSEMQLDDFFTALLMDIRKTGKKVVVSNASRLDYYNGNEIYGFFDLIKLFQDPRVREEYSLILNVSSLEGCQNEFIEYMKYINANDLASSVFIFNKKLNFPGLLRQSDVFIRATCTDGDSISVRESLALGVKTIASDCVKRPNGTIIYKTSSVISLKAALLSDAEINFDTVHSYDFHVVDLYSKVLLGRV